MMMTSSSSLPCWRIAVIFRIAIFCWIILSPYIDIYIADFHWTMNYAKDGLFEKVEFFCDKRTDLNKTKIKSFIFVVVENKDLPESACATKAGVLLLVTWLIKWLSCLKKERIWISCSEKVCKKYGKTEWMICSEKCEFQIYLKAQSKWFQYILSLPGYDRGIALVLLP